MKSGRPRGRARKLRFGWVGLFVLASCIPRSSPPPTLTVLGAALGEGEGAPATRTIVSHPEVEWLQTSCNESDEAPFVTYCGRAYSAGFDPLEVEANTLITADIVRARTEIAPSDELIAWSNANQVLLQWPCDVDVPPEVQYLACSFDDIADIAHLKTARDLKVLRLRTHFEAKRGVLTASHVAGLEHLEHLHHLDVGQLFVTDDALEGIGGLEQLGYLNLRSQGRYTLVGLRHLSALPKLQYLILAGFSLDDGAGLDVLREFESMPYLRYLDVSNTGLRDDDLSTLRRMSSLTYLEISSNHVSAEGLDDIARVRSLRIVRFRGQPGLAERMRELRPDLDVR